MAKPCCGTFWSNNFLFCPTCGESFKEKTPIEKIISNFISNFDLTTVEQVIKIRKLYKVI